MTRPIFRFSSLLALPLLFGAWIPTTSMAQNIGLALPFEERFEEASKLIENGVVRGLKESGVSPSIVKIPSDCSPDSTKVDIGAITQIDLVIGPLCFEAAKKLAKEFNANNVKIVPVLAIGPRSPLLRHTRDNDDLPLFVLGKGASAEADAFLELVKKEFAGKPFAIVDDGSVHGRSLADAIRLIGEERGIKPSAVATFRPFQSTQRAMLQRLRRSSIEALIIAGAPDDVKTITKDLRALNLDWEVAIGDQAALLPLLPDMNGLPESLLIVKEAAVPKTLAPQLTEPERKLFAKGLIAGEIAGQIMSGTVLKGGASFETSLGSIRFSSNGRAPFLPYEVITWKKLKTNNEGSN